MNLILHILEGKVLKIFGLNFKLRSCPYSLISYSKHFLNDRTSTKLPASSSNNKLESSNEWLYVRRIYLGQGQKNGLLFLALESTQLISVLPRLMRRKTNYIKNTLVESCDCKYVGKRLLSRTFETKKKY